MCPISTVHICTDVQSSTRSWATWQWTAPKEKWLSLLQQKSTANSFSSKGAYSPDSASSMLEGGWSFEANSSCGEFIRATVMLCLESKQFVLIIPWPSHNSNYIIYIISYLVFPFFILNQCFSSICASRQMVTNNHIHWLLFLNFYSSSTCFREICFIIFFLFFLILVFFSYIGILNLF